MNSLHCNKAVFGNRVFHQAGVYQRSSSWAFGLPGIPGRLPTSPSPHPLGPAFPCSWQSRLLAEQLPPFSHTTPVLLSSPSSSFSVTILTKPHLEWNQKNISESFSLTKKADNLRHGEGTSKEWFCLCELLLCHCDQSGWSEDPSVGRPRWKLTQAVGMIRRRRSEPTSRDVPTERPPSFFYP